MDTKPLEQSVIRALIVDDELISRRMSTFALQNEGFECDSASDGVEASELLSVRNYDVVVTDLQMPLKNGFAVVRELLANESPPLIIVHTSVIDPQVARQLIENGIDDIVFKPVNYPAFASKIRALLARQQIQQQFRNTANQISSINGSAQQPTEAASWERYDTWTPPPQPEDPIDPVEQYELGQLLGAGNMGEVYQAEHKLLNRQCAIKFIRPSIFTDKTAKSRFMREVRSVAKLSHYNNVNIFDFGVTRKGHFYYVMELLQGCTLDQILMNHGPLPVSRAIHLLAQACDGLREAHRWGLIHRDVKPSNLMCTHSENGSDTIKILDFGLVLDTVASQQAATVVTQAGTMCGTPAFMAPEQIKNPSQVDSRADIYSLGCTAYLLVTGKFPFGSTSPIAVVCAHMQEEASSPSELNPDLPAEIDAIILKCMRKDPNQRFQTMKELADALRACDSFGHWTKTDAKHWWTHEADSKGESLLETIESADTIIAPFSLDD